MTVSHDAWHGFQYRKGTDSHLSVGASVGFPFRMLSEMRYFQASSRAVEETHHRLRFDLALRASTGTDWQEMFLNLCQQIRRSYVATQVLTAQLNRVREIELVRMLGMFPRYFNAHNDH